MYHWTLRCVYHGKVRCVNVSVHIRMCECIMAQNDVRMYHCKLRRVNVSWHSKMCECIIAH